MNIIKSITMFSLAALALPLAADVLWFQVEQDPKNAIGFNYAAVKASSTQSSNGGYLMLDASETGIYLCSADASGIDTGVYQAFVSDTTLRRVDYNYAYAEYNYCVELYDSEMQLLGLSDLFSYSELKSFIYASGTGGGSASPWTVSSFHAVPEPSSGLLVLLGVGLMALRRRSRSIGGKLCAAALCVAAVGGAGAAQNDPLLFFSTPGDDTYQDGTKVADGECYALVWTKTGSAFAGINADGTAVDAVNNAVLTILPLAVDGCCPETGFQIDAALAEQYADGSYMLCLLDTRGADGKVLGVDDDGKVRAVNGYGLVKGASVQLAVGDIASLSGSDPAVTETESGIPTGTPKPEIKNFRVDGGKAYITVSGTVPYLKYNASRGETPDAIGKSDGDSRCATPVQGNAAQNITIIVPINRSSGFYTILRD